MPKIYGPTEPEQQKIAEHESTKGPRLNDSGLTGQAKTRKEIRQILYFPQISPAELNVFSCSTAVFSAQRLNPNPSRHVSDAPEVPEAALDIEFLSGPQALQAFFNFTFQISGLFTVC